MADYTEEQRVKQVYPDAEIQRFGRKEFAVVTRWKRLWWKPWAKQRKSLSACYLFPSNAWADASRRLGNEFVDEVGPLAERKEG